MEIAYLPNYIFAAIAVIAFIVMLVFAVRLITAKKEKRSQMNKSKIAVGVSAFLASYMLFMAIGFTVIIDTRPPVEKMPNIIGLSYKECKENYSDKFELVVEEDLYSSEYPDGAIIEQKPFEGSEYVVGRTTVHCKISRGVRMVHVPNVIGFDFEDAKTMLEYDFIVGFVSEYSDDVPKGNVIATDPPEFEKAAYGSAVKVTVSGGKEPDVTDSTEWYGELN